MNRALCAESESTDPMSETFHPGSTPDTLRTADGRVAVIPSGWVHLPPGDAALTRRVKAAGEHWLVVEKKGRRVFSLGLWAPSETISRIQAELASERDSDAWARRQASGARRREQEQDRYVEDFRGAVVAFLGFHPTHAAMASRLADAVTQRATPVGSGTVARTKRIPIHQRAEAAVIAWMRHATTGYDGMVIPRIKGKRREIRRMLAERSNLLLDRYRRGETVGDDCPLHRAIHGGPER